MPETDFWGASIYQGSPRQAPRSRGTRGAYHPFWVLTARTCLPSATMSGCSKRCRLGFVKFAQTIFKLITGTLNKGRETGFHYCALP